ncbi:hypothetical protein P280DRAFT_506536 [Massarina eburnea CBS 473.64]|uniref:RelA/SpoT domain-containing protein n=1 Tax=Massarina eburnea CBS 473.64 TaxID=1395130 RepID=A0A6A6S7D2_9PLEO|nr:hypothetical protein P280DRAFT_506536 [Massarina eburnea CBS 473.64]
MGASPHMFGQINPSTWVSQTQTPPVIEEFLDHYSQTHYHALANRAKELIEEELTNPEWHDIHVNVRCRAKTPKSLAEKLKIRHADHPYEKESDIWDDVHDLAGVRVILYMPSEDQREKVQRVIQAIWGDDVQQKYHEGSEDRLKVDERARLLQAPAEREKLSTKKQYRPRHLGYIAVHYRPKMKQSHHKRDKYFWEPKDRVEIQVVSALSHAWAEAGHDTLYKSYAYGPPTLHEEMLLDSLNGLVLSGELILQQFHELVMKRTSTPFRHRGDFGVFIRELDILQPHEGCTDHSYQDFEVESLDILLRFLIKTGKAYPLAVRNALKELGFPKEPKLDFIMAQEIKPSFKPAQGMTTTICLLRILMPPVSSEVLIRRMPS